MIAKLPMVELENELERFLEPVLAQLPACSGSW
jgi:hypothetical protein